MGRQVCYPKSHTFDETLLCTIETSEWTSIKILACQILPASRTQIVSILRKTVLCLKQHLVKKLNFECFTKVKEKGYLTFTFLFFFFLPLLYQLQIYKFQNSHQISKIPQALFLSWIFSDLCSSIEISKSAFLLLSITHLDCFLFYSCSFSILVYTVI